MAISPAIPCEGIDGSFTAETQDTGSYDVRQYMGVTVGSDDNYVTPLANTSTSGGPIISGVAQADADDAESVRIRLSGISKVRASGAVTRGDYCECIGHASDESLNGAMKTLTALADDGMIACRALEDAADGEYFKAMILIQVQHPAWS